MSDLIFVEHEETGKITSVKLYGTELLNESEGGQSDLIVNGLPLKTRPYPGATPEYGSRLKGECFIDHFSGWGLVVNRQIGERTNA